LSKAPPMPSGPTRKPFTRSTKSASFLRAATENPVRCAICDGLIHKNSIQIDHAVGLAKGGSSDISNAQLAHPYCNSIKENLDWPSSSEAHP
ncbi:MAG TPA: HNH endonuclease signature motif containing protein, partial [Gammaproteobacteria bacterium]|nr:HNH endonuclease signature motif containing protein [Gammaproteobacteria bacterium]